MIKIMGRNSFQKELSESCTVEALMKELGLRDQSFVCLRNGAPVTRHDTVAPSDEVVLMEIFSGG